MEVLRGTVITKEQATNLYNAYERELYKLALMMTRSKVMSEDIVSETFLKAFENYSKYDQTRPIKPWLTQILINNSREAFRKNKKCFLVETFPDQEDTRNFVEHFFSKEQEQAIWEMVNQLTLKSREVVVLHYYEELTLSEVASILQIPLGTCKSRLNTALNQLCRLIPNCLEAL